MEFCSGIFRYLRAYSILMTGGGLIDFMNTRLQDRLTESEILKIFGDVAQGVACMHYLQPPLLHRDIKVHLKLVFCLLIYRLRTS
jgi:AP2-associated kinase